MDGRRWMRVSLTRRTMRWSPRLYSWHMNCIRLSRSSRPSTSFPCIPATYRNSGSPAGGAKTKTREGSQEHCNVLVIVSYPGQKWVNIERVSLKNPNKTAQDANREVRYLFWKSSIWASGQSPCTDPPLSLTLMKDLALFPVWCAYTALTGDSEISHPPHNCLWGEASAQSASNTERQGKFHTRWIMLHTTISMCANNDTVLIDKLHTVRKFIFMYRFWVCRWFGGWKQHFFFNIQGALRPGQELWIPACIFEIQAN